MNYKKVIDLVEKRLVDGCSKLWCLNTCKIWNIELERTCLQNNIHIINLLLEAGANIHEDDDYVLREACYRGRLDVAKTLIEHGADVDAHGGDPLALAAQGDHLEIVKLLLEAGACDDELATKWASDGLHERIFHLLKQWKATHGL